MESKSFKDLLMYDETLFKEERVFDLDHIPESYVHRDSQMQSIAMCLRPALRGSRPINATIFGPPATGKTTAIRVMFEQIEDMPRGNRLLCVHVNCQIHASKFTVFSQIHKKLFNHLPPETGVPFSKLYDAIFKKLVKENKSLIVALDDMNYLFYDRHANEIIYDILRAHEVFPGARTAVFGVSSDMEFNYKFDTKVASMFHPQEIFFEPYSFDEIKDILKNRAKLGFFEGVISDELIEKTAEYAFSYGDLRVGIELLRVSALIAESTSSRKITEEHIENAYERSKSINLASLIKGLSSDEKELLRLVAKGEGPNSGSLFKAFEKKTKQSYTKFYRIVNKFEALRLVDTNFSGKGKAGRTRTISLRYEDSEILKALD